MKERDIDAQLVRERLAYDPATGVLTWLPRKGQGARNDMAGLPAGVPHKDGYIAVQVGRKKYLAHRLVWLLVTGDWPSGEVDHRNRVRDDNRWSNLRDTTKSGNQQNRGGVAGVDFVKRTGKWRAHITANGRCVALGSFKTEAEALAVRAAAKDAYHERV